MIITYHGENMYNFDPDETGVHMRNVFNSKASYNKYMKKRKKLEDKRKKAQRKQKK